jgi:MoaA/NifB/PqqE/SkfB family radical SAM enzyme
LWNEHEVEAMFALADGMGVRIDVDPEITGRDDGDMSPQDIGPTRTGMARLMDILQRRAAAIRKERPRRPESAEPTSTPAAASGDRKVCGAGSSSVTVDPFGNVYPCVQWRRRIGNLHDASIKAMWNHSDELTEVRRLAVEAKKIVDGLATPGFGYCPGSAERETGRATKLYPVARLLLELQQRAAIKSAG